ncbi:hypothetical protein NEHOM01_1007 [Nematocida homosporus]|uniref:uncharacterized protein n=1 Tax=Nematocida homosporus TaxID=1912981 RepID=UPI00221F9AA7|nr:uncharacterized protein NEHOM01_1007 [Nematocida homosporus]KAI5185715.1 hypothetical protein NEHOM01_1007 [Nematocida homosporus]
MIESTALRKFAISYFLTYPNRPLCTLVDKIAQHIERKFFKGEIVFIKEKELTGCIVESTKTGYLVEIYDDNQPVPQKEEIPKSALMRKDSATKNEVLLFLLNSTRDTPLGRVVLGTAVQDLGLFMGQTVTGSAVRQIMKPDDMLEGAEARKWQFNLSSDKKDKELAAIELQRQEAQKSAILEVPRTIWTLPDADFWLNQRVLAVYGQISTFSAFFKTEPLSLDDFITALFKKEPKDTAMIDMCTKFLKAVGHERRKSGKEGLRDIIQIATEVVYHNPSTQSIVARIKADSSVSSGGVSNSDVATGSNSASSSGATASNNATAGSTGGFTRIQWFAGDASAKTWLSYMKSFVYDIINAYGIKIKTLEFLPGGGGVQNELSQLADRLLILSFLLEICMLGLRFRAYFDAAVDEFKEKEKERAGLLQELRRLKGELLLGRQTDQDNTALNEAEQALAVLNNEYKPELLRASIGFYLDIHFFMIDKRLLYIYHEEVYMIREEHWNDLFTVLGTDKKKDGVILDTMKKYLRLV